MSDTGETRSHCRACWTPCTVPNTTNQRGPGGPWYLGGGGVVAVCLAGRQQPRHQAARVAAADEVAGAGSGFLQEAQGLVEVSNDSIT